MNRSHQTTHQGSGALSFRNRQLISVSGVDGSGKSTQIAHLARTLEQSGAAVSVRWYRPGYSTRLNKLRHWIRSARPTAIPPADPTATARIELFEKQRVQVAWVMTALLDTWIEYAVVSRIALLKHDTVIYDRHLADAELDLRLNFPEQGRITTVGLALIGATMKRPQPTLLLQVPFEVSEARRSNKNEPYPETSREALARSTGYSPDLERWKNAVTIDATQTEFQVASDISTTLGLTTGKASDG